MTVPKHHWSECRPALLSLADAPGQPQRRSVEEMVQLGLAVTNIWDHLPVADRQAFHRACCLNSRAPGDMEAMARITKAISEVL